MDHQDLLPAVKLAKLLHPELNQRAIDQRCYGGQSAWMSQHEIIRWLVKKYKSVSNLLKSCLHIPAV